jgi:hypothetical protein
VNTATLLARFNYVNRIVKTSPPAIAVPPGPTTTAPPAAAVDLATYAAFTPDDVVRAAGGLDPNRVLATIARDAIQDDLTSEVRGTMLDYLESKNATLPTPFGPENYQEKIRGALALVLNLPANQLN